MRALLLLLVLAACGAEEPPCILAGPQDTIQIGPREPLGPGGAPSVEVQCQRPK